MPKENKVTNEFKDFFYVFEKGSYWAVVYQIS